MKYFKISLLVVLTMLLGFGAKTPARADQVYNLAVESLVMNSAKCELNQVCSFTARVKNLGADFPLNFPIKSSATGDGYSNESPVAVLPEPNTTIKTGDYITFSIYGTFSKIGAIVLNFSVDTKGYLVESQTNDNTGSLTVNVTGYDLAVEDISVSPAYPRVGQDCYIRVKVKNNSSYNLYSESGLTSTRDFPDFSLTAASSTRPTFSNLIKPGDYLYWGYAGTFASAGEKLLSFTIDPDDTLAESNSTNNKNTSKISVYGAADADLTIHTLNLSADKIILGEPFDITWGIKNTGKTSLTDSSGLAKTESNFNLPYFDYGINDLTLDNYPSASAPFNPGDTFHYKLHGVFNQPGMFILDFAINQGRQLLEANYGDDATSTAIRVYRSRAEADDFSILSKRVDLVSSSTAVISWTTDLATTGILNYGRTPNLVSDSQINETTAALTHTVTLEHLIPGLSYSFMITANNGTAQKTEMNNKFSMTPDDLIRILNGPVVVVTGQRATTTWTTNLISSGYVYYRKKGETTVNLAGSDTKAANHEVALKNLAPGQYDYFVSSTSTPSTNVKTGWSGFEIASTSSLPVTPFQNDAVKTGSAAMASFSAINNSLYAKLKGKIILRIQSQGQAYYLSPKDQKLYSLGKPDQAYEVIRNQAVGMTNADLAKIPVGLAALSGIDTDKDGLPDALETSLGTDPSKSDTDADGFSDKDELIKNYSPVQKNQKLNFNNALIAKFKGRILLQAEGRGQAWYVNPADGKRYFLSRPADAFNLMRQLGLGVTDSNYAALGGK